MALNLAILAGKNIAQLTADFAPIPWMGPAVGAVLTIMQLVQNVQTNRQAAIQLGGRCVLLLQSLQGSVSGDPSAGGNTSPDRVENAFTSILIALREIEQRMGEWASYPKAMAFVKQKVIVESIQKSHLLLDDCTLNFQLISDIESHRWQLDFERLSRQDHLELLAQVAEITQNQKATQQLILSLQNNFQDMMSMMASMQDGLGNFHVGDRRHTGLSHGLFGLQQASGELLPDYTLNKGEVRKIGSNAKGASASMDIWEGMYLEEMKVCIKIIRGVEVTPRTKARFYREVKVWRKVWEVDRGRHTLPFLGMCNTDGKYPYMVSPWMANGDAISYVKRYPEMDRKQLVFGIAKGLKMLHEMVPNPIVHGDLKGANIVINDNLEPLIADFGMAKILQNVTGIPFTQSRGISESYRWFAPELATEPGELSTHSDIFSFSMTILELMTGEHPFVEIRRTPEVLLKLVDGTRPRRPTNPAIIERGLDDALWSLLTRCWDPALQPEERPTIQQVHRELEVFASTQDMTY